MIDVLNHLNHIFAKLQVTNHLRIVVLTVLLSHRRRSQEREPDGSRISSDATLSPYGAQILSARAGRR
ncbi:hypothetical protein [Phytohabitans kaempferiae]|uniref:hypothetical protein n=1 Tax=Phytohabitans kaempferiae TaxID=1620943 RepID=UPI00366C1C13